MSRELLLLLRDLGDKIDPQISAFLIGGLERGTFDFSVYTEVFDVKILVNRGNEKALRQLIEKFRLIVKPDVHHIIARCLSLDVVPAEPQPPEDNSTLFKRTVNFFNKAPRSELDLGTYANKRFLEYGRSIDRITEGITSSCRGYNRLEAFAIAWMVTDTFLHTAENKVRLDGFKATGVVERKCWITQRDGKVRRAHEQAERQEVGLYEPFRVGGEKLHYPGDPAASFENILLCRCYMVPMS